MANITFIIGNGFDLQIGMNTRYTDFYNVYTKNEPDKTNLIFHFKKSILKDKANGWKNWADFELRMGQASESDIFANPQDFITCVNDFVIKFSEYLKKESQSIDWDKVAVEEYDEFFNSITQFWKRIKNSDQNIFAKAVVDPNANSLNFLQLNYTDSFDNLLPYFKNTLNQRANSTTGKFIQNYGIRNVENNLHIHGTLGHHPAIGVDNPLQIVNPQIREDVEASMIFVKPKLLETIQNQNVNVPIDSKKAPEIIQSSRIICCYGTSIGDTDMSWWKIIGDWLKSDNHILVIFDICDQFDDGTSLPSLLKDEQVLHEKRRSILDQFKKCAGWTEDDSKQHESKIVVELNCKMFDFKLPKKSDHSSL